MKKVKYEIIMTDETYYAVINKANEENLTTSQEVQKLLAIATETPYFCNGITVMPKRKDI